MSSVSFCALQCLQLLWRAYLFSAMELWLFLMQCCEDVHVCAWFILCHIASALECEQKDTDCSGWIKERLLYDGVLNSFCSAHHFLILSEIKANNLNTLLELKFNPVPWMLRMQTSFCRQISPVWLRTLWVMISLIEVWLMGPHA